MQKKKTGRKPVAPSGENLKAVLWDTITEVRDGKINTQTANAICSNARAICSVVKLELQIAKLTGNKPSVKSKRFAAVK